MLNSFTRGVLDTFDATAAIDVGFMAVLIYLALVGLQRVRTSYALRGAVLLAALYLVARQFNLALTSSVLEGFLLLVLVALVMIYREELRRLVERLARVGQRRNVDPGPQAELTNLLSNCVFELAAKRWGALIVLASDEPVEPHITGGTRLGGEPSAPLIKSIFDPSSAGHDGALLVEAGVVTWFGCHLPLSSDLEALGDRGTRHAAALGMSEHCNAMCLVVSEERGVVSYALAGELREMSNPAELVAAINKHLGHGPARRSGLRALLVDHHGAKLAALFMAAVAWLVLVYGGQSMQQSSVAAVEWRSLGPELSVTAVQPREVSIVATGARRDFALSSRSPTRLVVTLAGHAVGVHRVAVSPEDVTLPKGLSLKSVTPAEVTIRIAAKTQAPKP